MDNGPGKDIKGLWFLFVHQIYSWPRLTMSLCSRTPPSPSFRLDLSIARATTDVWTDHQDLGSVILATLMEVLESLHIIPGCWFIEWGGWKGWHCGLLKVCIKKQGTYRVHYSLIFIVYTILFTICTLLKLYTIGYIAGSWGKKPTDIGSKRASSAP